jgi:hypothetical protein
MTLAVGWGGSSSAVYWWPLPLIVLQASPAVGCRGANRQYHFRCVLGLGAWLLCHASPRVQAYDISRSEVARPLARVLMVRRL